MAGTHYSVHGLNPTPLRGSIHGHMWKHAHTVEHAMPGCLMVGLVQAENEMQHVVNT